MITLPVVYKDNRLIDDLINLVFTLIHWDKYLMGLLDLLNRRWFIVVLNKLYNNIMSYGMNKFN